MKQATAASRAAESLMDGADIGGKKDSELEKELKEAREGRISYRIIFMILF